MTLWNTNESDTFTNNYWQLWSGYGPASGNTDGQVLPTGLFTQVNVDPWCRATAARQPALEPAEVQPLRGAEPT